MVCTKLCCSYKGIFIGPTVHTNKQFQVQVGPCDMTIVLLAMITVYIYIYTHYTQLLNVNVQ